jgi:GTP 3',8-cyclase
MNNRHDRQISYLRLSLTAACQMRCTYCRPDWLRGGRDANQLTAAEIESVVRHLVSHHGLSKVRLTGGDPTARPDLVEIITRLAGIDGINDLAMTTNGLSLARFASDYAAAGLHRVNLSLDSLDPVTFERMTGIDGLALVRRGIDAAIDAGLKPIRLNTVVLAAENDAELPDLVRFAAERDLQICFIELMPMGPLADHWAERYVPEATMRQRLDPIVTHWRPIALAHDSARRFLLTLDDQRQVTVGFITPMSCNFCAACNRLRLTADGNIYPCLMDEPRGSFMSAVRPAFDGHAFDRLLVKALAAKAPEHPTRGVAVMTTIGG